MLLDDEISLLNNTIDQAVTLAALGELCEGYDELAYGLERAKAHLGFGLTWPEELLPLYQQAVENYCVSYLPAWDGPE